MDDFQQQLEELTINQMSGLHSLLSLAIVEQTTVMEQCEIWGYEQVPQTIVAFCDFSDIAIGLLLQATASCLLNDLLTIQKAKKICPLFDG